MIDPCDGCAAGCCRHFSLVIFGWDLYRIARDLRLSPESFVETIGAPAPDLTHQLILDAAADQRSYHRLELKKEREGCVFLLSLGGKGRCGIYGSRPGACRTYPALLDGDLFQLTKREHCPPGAWDQIDEALYRPRYRFGLRQRDIHDVVGDGWNERVLVRRESRSAAQLFGYLMSVYAALEARVPDWFSPTPIPLTEAGLREEISTVLGQIGWL